jgi:hypothetical protein
MIARYWRTADSSLNLQAGEIIQHEVVDERMAGMTRDMRKLVGGRQ